MNHPFVFDKDNLTAVGSSTLIHLTHFHPNELLLDIDAKYYMCSHPLPRFTHQQTQRRLEGRLNEAYCPATNVRSQHTSHALAFTLAQVLPNHFPALERALDCTRVLGLADRP